MYPLYLFPAPTPEGEQFCRRAVSLSKELGYESHIVRDATQKSLTQACMSNQVVVFDATVDCQGRHLYSAATALAMALDQVLIVSRSYLPLNFSGARTGGAPDYPDRLDDEDILRWLQRQLFDLRSTQPRKPLGFRDYFKAMKNSFQAARDHARKEGQIFVSYRSRAYDQVRLLAGRISAGEFHQEPKTVKIIPPGALAYDNELLTLHRRWMLLAMIEEAIAAAEEIWIYDTPEYYESWWTQGEIILALRMLASPSARIRIFCPTTNELRPLPANAVPVLTAEHKARLARFGANANPRTMGPEAIQAMGTWRKVPLVGKLPYFNDPVWSDEFNFWPLIQCDRCSERTLANHAAFPGRRFVSRIDVDAFLGCEAPLLHKVAPQLLGEVLRGSRSLPCPGGCGSVFKLDEAPARFLWYAVRCGRPTGPDGGSISKVPCIRATPAS